MPLTAADRISLPFRHFPVKRSFSEQQQDERHLARYAKAMIRYTNYWHPQLKLGEATLVLHVLAQTYGRGDRDWTTIPNDLIPSRSYRKECASHLEKLGLLRRKNEPGAGTEYRIDLDVLFKVESVNSNEEGWPLQRPGGGRYSGQGVAATAAGNYSLIRSLSLEEESLKEPPLPLVPEFKCWWCKDTGHRWIKGNQEPCGCAK